MVWGGIGKYRLGWDWVVEVGPGWGSIGWAGMEKYRLGRDGEV